MKIASLRILSICLPLFIPPLFADEAGDSLLSAAASGDAPQIVLALSEADPNIRDKDGRTPLMLAAGTGDFESVRRLLWGGADPTLKDFSGKTARDYIDLKKPGSAPISLIVRCYVYCKEQARPGGKARVPELALVNDIWVDPFHPKLKPFYYVNEAELNGRNGADDDNNGFVDDVYGWNLYNDIPLKAPQFAIDGSPTTQAYLESLMKEFQAANSGDQRMMALLKNRHVNPLVRQLGFRNLNHVGIDLNDYAFASMLDHASHGTHVAGIIVQYSEGKAKIHGADIGASTPRTVGTFDDYTGLIQLAGKTDSYAGFVRAAIEQYRAERAQKGRRASDYLRAIGAGVANMSWNFPNEMYEGLAKNLEIIYSTHGKNPSSVSAPHKGMDAITIANLPLELRIADAASFALVFYENPDVFICIAAGNEGRNNDETLASPCYLSRFFPNVITVAALSEANKPSTFSNFGVRSVQIAALGENMVAPILNNMEAPKNGTSMASPLVAGVAAGIRKDFPNLSAPDVRRLLEASVTKDPSYANFVSTSGRINPSAARAMATSWSSDNLAMLVEEVRAAKKPGPDGPTIKIPSQDTNPAKQSPTGKPYRITGVSGFKNVWRISMSQDSPYTDQMHLGVGPWPEQHVNEAWEKGYRITDVGGDADGWNVVMSKGIPGRQFIVGYSLDQSLIASNMEAGLHITSVAGWKDNWITVMTSDTGWGKQRYTLPTPFTGKRQQWIKDRWDEGYRITSVSGDDLPEDDKDGWLFVVTQGTGITEQTYSLPGPWPAKWIEENSAKGFRANGQKRAKEVESRVSRPLAARLEERSLELGSPVFIRAFKEELELELFVRNPETGKFELFETYPIAGSSGQLGPKLAEGDRQVPEGFYYVPPSAMNPNSRYHLSFNIGYPNTYDRAHHRTGSHIMIHGSNVSIGCLAMTDPVIEEIYTLASAAHRAGQPYFRVHIFPFRMTDARMGKARDSPHLPFWRNLRTGYDHFEKNKTPPDVSVSRKTYTFNCTAPGSAIPIRQMINFSIFNIPVRIEPFFWLTLAFISGRLFADSKEQIFGLLLFILAGFISILVHELGHALTAKSFGKRVHIVLQAFGGYAEYDNLRPLRPTQSFAVTAAGPAIQIILGFTAMVCLKTIPNLSIYAVDFLRSLQHSSDPAVSAPH
eukprot:g3718.t1